MLTSEHAGGEPSPHPASPLIGRSCRISTTPARPISSPAHCKGVTRSRDQRFASVEVRIGCSPGISADNPAGNRMRDRNRGAAEIKTVHQDAGDGAVRDADAIRPARTRDHER